MSVFTGILILMLLFVLRFGVPFGLTMLFGRLMRIRNDRLAMATGS